MRRKTFTHEFKQECVNLVLQHKYPVTQAAETMNIGLSTLQRWLRQYRGEVRAKRAKYPLKNNAWYCHEYFIFGLLLAQSCKTVFYGENTFIK